MTSTFLHHTNCPKCGSKNNLGVYTDHVYCFGCEYTAPTGDKKIAQDFDTDYEEPKTSSIIGLPSRTMPSLRARGLDSDSINKYRVTVGTDKDGDIEAIFPRFSSDGQHIANQIRLKGKNFRCEGKISSAALFGQDLFPPGGRSITVTEGYYDTLSAFQLTGSRYPNVGVMSASTAKKEIVANFEYLSSFDKVVLNFDSDEPGQKAAKECAGLFEPGKVSILKLDRAKDANEYLKEGLIKEYVNEWFRAPTFMPDGLQLGTDLWDDIENHKTPYSVPYPWEGLNHKTYGIRRSEFVLVTAETGVGKTSVMKEIEYSLLMNEELRAANAGVGFLHLEEPKYDTAMGLMSIYANKPYHLPDTERTTEELREAFDKVINTDRVVIYDHFGSNDIDVILAKVRHMSALGCKYVVIDHLSIIVSDQAGDERKQLDEISTKLKTLTMNLDIAIIAVIHVNRQGQIRGSAGPEQVANIIFRLEREKKDPNDWRRNITRLTVEKNRFCGRTGPACYLFYNEMTNRLEELPPDMVDKYESGDSGAGHEFF